jgi:hypothetical protein
MSLTRVHNFSISLDGFGTGEGQSHDAHFGHAGERLHEWLFTTRWWQPGGSGGVDDAFAQQHDPGIGAEIMGAAKFGHPGWHEDPQWKGAWGPYPPFHTHRSSSSPITRARRSRWRAARPSTSSTPRLPRRSRPPARPPAARTYASAGVMIRDFLAAGLIDYMHIVVVPILLGRGVRLWHGLEGLEKDYRVEATSSPSGVTHVTFTRTGL